MEGGSAIFLLIDCCNNNSGPGSGCWYKYGHQSSASAAATEPGPVWKCEDHNRPSHNYTLQLTVFLFTLHLCEVYIMYILCRVCKFQDDRRHHDKCRSHPCWRGAACSAPGKPQPRERQPEEAAKNLSKSPSSESEVLQVELNLVA